MERNERAIITAASNKFFPLLINFLTSIKLNYPDHPRIYVYNLGLLPIFREEIKAIENVELVAMPHFCNHWRSCYTWKTYIFSHPIARNNFYLDAGCQVLGDFGEDFDTIEREEVLLIDQGQSFGAVVPDSYKEIFDLPESINNLETFAGTLGFKDTLRNKRIFGKVYNAAIAGLALGFSSNDAWRNRGKDKNIFVRDCTIFRHDLTLLNIFFRKEFEDRLIVYPVDKYHGRRLNSPLQKIWQIRLNYSYLEHLNIKSLHGKIKPIFVINRLIINIMICAKNAYFLLKNCLILFAINDSE